MKKLVMEIDDEDHAGMLELAQRNGRTLLEESRHAVKRHLAAPPTVKMIEPRLPDATVEREPEDKPRRGRPPRLK